MSFTHLQEYAELANAGRNADLNGLPQLRVALLSDAATQLLVPLLKELYRQSGVGIEVYEGPFAAIELIALNPASELYQFKPHVIVLLNATQALRSDFFQRDPAFDLDEMERRITMVWDALRANTSALIVQSTYVTPYERITGNFDLKYSQSWISKVSELNHRILHQARERNNVMICDSDGIASWIGRREWFDERFWDLAKSYCSTECMPALAKNIVDITMAFRGRAVKCVICDLDNTLWGGVIGDDGIDGIQLSAHGNGEAFHRFQSFLLALRKRGILLCVCSKNEMAAALKPFEEHPEMVLRKDDITIFIANWENKAENIKRIRESLEIGYDSMLFVDDNPFERSAVRAMLPDVLVPELPEDPADYVKALSTLNLFEATTCSTEDSARTELYRAEFARRSSANEFSTFEGYLASLEMTIDVCRFTASRINRIAQLLLRSNQFNLTTHRYNEKQCEELMSDPNCIPLQVSLQDRFGDHGLISIIVARPDTSTGTFRISDWLMSCRVLARGVEEFLMNYVVETARNRDLKFVEGSYIPTAKNAMVRDFFAKFDFEKVQVAVDGTTVWRLSVAKYTNRTTYVTLHSQQEPIAAETA